MPGFLDQKYFVQIPTKRLQWQIGFSNTLKIPSRVKRSGETKRKSVASCVKLFSSHTCVSCTTYTTASGRQKRRHVKTCEIAELLRKRGILPSKEKKKVKMTSSIRGCFSTASSEKAQQIQLVFCFNKEERCCSL